MFSGTSKKQKIIWRNQFDNNGVPRNPRLARHGNRYPLAPTGRPPDLQIGPRERWGNDRHVMNDHR